MAPPDATKVESREARDMRWSALMVAVQSGDERAYDRLLREILPLLRGIALARLRDAAEAEDAIQDALLTLHRVRATYDPARPFTPWMAAIAERRALDRGRSRGRRAAREVKVEAAEHIPSPAAPEAERGLARAELRAAIGALPVSQQTALKLAKIEELSLMEASARSGLSVGALKVATHRAMRNLRKRLGALDATSCRPRS
ncbi:sigma-70 family RNA polymerase sigma factor [Roseomonas hellenica]|uniref:Sigma-70 family RNA polymerase sigma factor n=2 Tax=Plastoroseomonas hellenica TaxID=2687306 RepID=A0ABS5EXP0_9PROT|nr:sigma-70 family RNA polymerase sigma factor [Plastoroseomonas hellenica]